MNGFRLTHELVPWTLSYEYSVRQQSITNFSKSYLGCVLLTINFIYFHLYTRHEMPGYGNYLWT